MATRSGAMKCREKNGPCELGSRNRQVTVRHPHLGSSITQAIGWE